MLFVPTRNGLTQQKHRVRGGCGLRLPTEPCVRIRTRLLTQDEPIGKHQTNVPFSGRIALPVLSG